MSLAVRATPAPPPPYGGAGNVSAQVPGISVGLFENNIKTSDFEVPAFYPAYYRVPVEVNGTDYYTLTEAQLLANTNGACSYMTPMLEENMMSANETRWNLTAQFLYCVDALTGAPTPSTCTYVSPDMLFWNTTFTDYDPGAAYPKQQGLKMGLNQTNCLCSHSQRTIALVF